MKAISLWQPWASLMEAGIKTNETRSWLTNYRGELAICASKRKPAPHDLSCDLANLLIQTFSRNPGHRYSSLSQLLEALPHGKVLCVVDIVNCVPTECFHGEPCAILNPDERFCGDYSKGRFAWLTRNLRALKNPVPVIGRQGLFNLPPDVEALVRKEI